MRGWNRSNDSGDTDAASLELLQYRFTYIKKEKFSQIHLQHIGSLSPSACHLRSNNSHELSRANYTVKSPIIINIRATTAQKKVLEYGRE